MPAGPQQNMITPFADAAMRLLREKWANPNMLAEELFPIFQIGVPTVVGRTTVQVNYGSSPESNVLTLDNFGIGDLLRLRDQFGNTVFRVDQFGSSFAAGDFNYEGTKPLPGHLKEYDLKRPSDPTLNRRRPQIVWANPEDITVGTPLSGTQLNAVAADAQSGRAIEGTFVYDPPSGTVLPAGNGQTLSVLFTPRDLNLYRRLKATVTINVTSSLIETHIVSTPGNFYDTSPAFDFSYEDQGGFTVAAHDPDENVVPGTFAFTPDVTSTPLMGQTSVHVVFTPTDPLTYEGCEGDITVSITRPSINWNGTIVTAQSDGSDPVGADATVLDFGFGDLPLGTIDSLFDTTIVGNVHATDAFIGSPIGGTYSFDDEAWYYEFSPF